MCDYKCIHAFIHAHPIYMRTYIHSYIYIHIHTYIYTYIYIYIHIHTYAYIYIHIHTHTYIYIHIHMQFLNQKAVFSELEVLKAVLMREKQIEELMDVCKATHRYGMVWYGMVYT